MLNKSAATKTRTASGYPHVQQPTRAKGCTQLQAALPAAAGGAPGMKKMGDCE
jgi:hypothetical protein